MVGRTNRKVAVKQNIQKKACKTFTVAGGGGGGDAVPQSCAVTQGTNICV